MVGAGMTTPDCHAIAPPTADKLPDQVEICARVRDGNPCLGVMYRPNGGTPWCYRCSSTAPGVMYVRQEAK